MKRLTFFLVSFVSLVVACTGGPGPIDQTGTGSTSSSGGSNGTSSSGGSGSGTTGGTGSGTNQTVSASEFSQSCVEDTDCIAVYEGAACNQCGCPNSAIARTDLAAYSTKRASAGCSTTDQACANDCAEATAICAQGTCSITTGASSEPDGG
jgi:trimeric autotransporter adhesin